MRRTVVETRQPWTRTLQNPSYHIQCSSQHWHHKTASSREDYQEQDPPNAGATIFTFLGSQSGKQLINLSGCRVVVIVQRNSSSERLEYTKTGTPLSFTNLEVNGLHGTHTSSFGTTVTLSLPWVTFPHSTMADSNSRVR